MGLGGHLSQADKELIEAGVHPVIRKGEQLKDTCKRCRYWTLNKKHGEFKCYTNQCPAKQRDEAPRNTAGAPTYLTAIRTVGKAMGDQKFNNHMMGSMMPNGELDVATVIALLYKKSVASVRRKLAAVEKAEFDSIRAKMMKKHRARTKKRPR